MFLRLTIYLFIPSLIEGNVYLYNTHDNLSVEFYDCINDTNLPYCRRPSEPIAVQRDQSIWHCDHGGISHSFSSLFLKNVSFSTVLHEWSSSIEKVEEYSRYKEQRQSNEVVSSDEKYLCQCIDPQSFGKNCEYLLPMGITFHETIAWEVEMRTENEWKMQMHSDIVCYTTLICDFGLLCLDWRDICDGIQHCMYGYDEENCDKLEFNECEDDEYRCVNGMCIPDQYFLDGEYDCLDLTDEKEQFNDRKCTFEQASEECDDRMCLRSYWSCGDGQCIARRLKFQSNNDIECNSLREQYYMCEMAEKLQWTLPNEKCYRLSDYEVLVQNRTDSEECLYFVKCALSWDVEKNCPCKSNVSCINKLENPCSSSIIRYPNGAIIAPYAFSFYNATRDWSDWIPDGIIINGTLKCRGYMIERSTILEYPSEFRLRQLEATLCASESNISVLSDTGYDEFCHNESRTFNNHSYHFIDVCKQSKECISAYRIKDGYGDCAYFEDEQLSTQFPNTCSNIQRHRFRCSSEEPSCLFVNNLGDEYTDCRNARDEWWMGEGIKLSKLICNSESKDDCGRIRQYIEASGKLDTNNSSDQQLKLSKIPFRAFCDTFWNWGSKEDEDVRMCQKWWKCPENQWQCRTGQCIKTEWVLDGEWDCVDASDEQGLFVPTNNFSLNNLNPINNEQLLIEKFIILYSNQSFWQICNLSAEYPCFRINVSDPLNITHNRPCISLHQIGDGRIDCVGGLDERNNLKHCNLSTMLGYYFQCSSTATCISYSSHCSAKCDDNNVQCYGYKQTSNCSEKSDFMCLDRQCAKEGWCNQIFDCSHGEDELFCLKRTDSIYISPIGRYREEKEFSLRTTKQELQLPQLPIDNHGNKTTDIIIPILQSEISATNLPDEMNPIISYYCNRGIGVELSNKSIVCFCPPQYYGDKCQFHNDRITILFHLNLSQSIYSQSNNPKTMLKLLIIFMNENQPLMTESFQMKVIDEMIIPRKKLVHLFYSRSNVSLYDKRARYFNRSDIINEHPYSVRIEAYDLNLSEEPQLVGVWLYPIYFDFIPSFRLAKVLHLPKPDVINNPCSSNPCNGQQKCYPILNQNSTYVCLCLPNYKGENCSLIDKMCKGFCSLNSLCKPTYRGTLSGIEQPYCICPLNKIGHKCYLIHDRCDPNPCYNNGTCLSTLEPNRFICLCDEYHFGDECQLEKRGVRLHIKNIPSHRAAVVQYFDINVISLDLILVYQHVYDNLPDLLHYLSIGKTAPEIIVVKFYSNTQSANIYLISIQIDVESINATIEMNETNHCAHVETLFPTKEKIIPFKYHHLCVQNQHLLCFVDNSYLCICEENHNRAECFGYDYNLDQCSSCLSGGQCLKANRSKSDFVCLCPECYSGKSCEFSSEHFSFTVDQLFSKSLASKGSIEKKIITVLLIFGSWFLFLIGLLNNICCFVTFSRVKCLRNGIGHYLLWMSVTNQINLTFLALRLTHLTLNSTNFRSDPYVDMISCKILNYSLISSGRIPYWLVPLIAIERVYTTIFLRGQWLKKPHIAKRLLMIMLSLVLVSGSYELYFVQSHIDLNSDNGAVCTLYFPPNRHIWTNIHKIVTIIHTLVPFLINICSTMIISYVIIKKKIKINARVVYAHPTNIQKSENTEQQEQTAQESQDNVEQKDNDDDITHLPTVKEKNRLYLLRDVLIENKELILGPGITLIPQLFSLPLFIISIAFACQDIEANYLRYLVITSSVISFIPQLTTFFLYISPSSFYTQEWRLTNLNKWLHRFRQCCPQVPLTMTTISCTTKDNNKLEITKSK